MKTVYFIRHGETNFNIQGLCNGEIGDIYLTENGIKQAKEVGEKIKHIQFDLIITSGLPRVTRTLENMYEGILPPHEIDHRIKELKTGFDARPIKEYLDFIKDDPVHAKKENGQSFFEVFQNVTSFIEDLKNRPESTILVVSHRVIIRAIKMYYENIPLELVETIPVPGNCDIYTIKL